MFAFDLKTCYFEDSEDCEPYAAGVYHLKNPSECFKGDINKEELATERSKVHVFDRENSNPVLKMIDFIENKYKGQTKLITIKYGKHVLSSYKYQMVEHNAGGFDDYFVLNSLPISHKCKKGIQDSGKSSRNKISFKTGSVIENGAEIPKNMKFVCSKCQISGSLKNMQKEYNKRSESMKRCNPSKFNYYW